MKKIEFKNIPYDTDVVNQNSLLWINPEKIIGYDKKLNREKNRKYFFDKQILNSNKEDFPDEIISDYLFACLTNKKCRADVSIQDFSSGIIFLIVELNSTWAAYNSSIYTDDYLQEHVGELDILMNIFRHTYSKETDNHTKNLLKIFILDVLQYGAEWGIDESYRYHRLSEDNKRYLERIANEITKDTCRY